MADVITRANFGVYILRCWGIQAVEFWRLPLKWLVTLHFDTEPVKRVPKPDFPSNFTFAKIQDGGRPPSWNQLNGHNLAIFERQKLRKKIWQRPKMRSRNNVLSQNLHTTKSKMAAAAILKFTFRARIWLILHIFLTKLIQRLQTGSQSRICHQNSHPPKLTMADGRHLEIS